MITNPIVVDMDVGTPQIVPMTISQREPVPMGFSEAINVIVKPVVLEDKDVVPSEDAQTITFDEGYQGLGNVIVEPIPSNYGRIVRNGVNIKVY